MGEGKTFILVKYLGGVWFRRKRVMFIFFLVSEIGLFLFKMKKLRFRGVNRFVLFYFIRVEGRVRCIRAKVIFRMCVYGYKWACFYLIW